MLRFKCFDFLRVTQRQTNVIKAIGQAVFAMFADLNSDALRFQELYYNERKHIAHLDDQRRAGFEDVLQSQPDPLTSSSQEPSALV